jgi:basic amino acid/polyamine antiporter, APA family
LTPSAPANLQTTDSPPANPDSLLVRAIGVRQLAATIFNYTVGSGIFALPATAAAQLGTAAPLAYVACAILMLLIAASFAEAGSRVSASGGPYAYIGSAFGPFVGLLAGIFLAVSALSGAAVIATLFAGSALALVNVPASSLTQGAIVLGISVAAVIFNVRGVRWGVGVVEFMTTAKLVPLVLFVLVGASFVRPENLAWAHVPDATSVLATSGIVIFAFMGIESSLAPSGEVRDPHHTVPRAAFLALLAVCVLYLSVQAVAQGILGPALGTTRITPLAAAADAAVGGPGRAIMLAGATVSMLGALLGSFLINPRIVFAMARDHFLPRYIAAVHPVYRTPHRAIVASAIVVVAMAVTGTFERLLIISNISGLIVYALVALSAVALQRRDVRAGGAPFRCGGGPLVHVIALGGTAWMLSAIVSRNDLIGLALMTAATVVVYGARRLRGPVPISS